MSKPLVKIRLSNCRSLKPFWVNLDEINDSFRSLNNFIKTYCHKNDNIHIRGHHHLIFFHQLPSYKVDGYDVKARKIINPCCKKMPKFYRRRFKCIRRYATNTKVDYWAKHGIYPIPLPKVIKSQKNLKDPSGINPITRDQLDKILIDNCFGIFYSNSVNYAKKQGWDIQFNIDCRKEDNTHEYLVNVSPIEILRIVYSYYKFGNKKLITENNIIRSMADTTYGWLKPVLPSADYGDVILKYRDFEFGKIIIECNSGEYKYWKEIPLVINNQQFQVIDEIKSFINETEIDHNTKIIITFKSDVIYKEAKNVNS